MSITEDNGSPVKLARKDFQSDQEVRWCPGCGDYGILTAIQLMLPETGIKPEDLVFVSGIGCAARLPYYMNTYGIHSIHGRAPAVATGVALARPDLHVWVIGGDGDMLSIGGNHLIHALAPQREHEDPHVQQPDLRPHQGSVLADERDGQGHEVDAVRLARPPVQPDLGRARRGGDVRRPHPRHGPQAHDRGVHAGQRAPGRGVRRGVPELQRVQRRRVRHDPQQGRPARHVDQPPPRRADPLRHRPGDGRRDERARRGADRPRRRRRRAAHPRARREPPRPVARVRAVAAGRASRDADAGRRVPRGRPSVVRGRDAASARRGGRAQRPRRPRQAAALRPTWTVN